MTDPTEETDAETGFPPELKQRLHALVDALVDRDGPDHEFHLAELGSSARSLLERKLSLLGTKSETRRHLEALLSRRMAEVFDGVADGGEGCEALAAEVLLGTLLSGAMLSDFADAVDKVILQCGQQDYCFAGRADFIGLEEVLQLLGGASHRGILSLEKPDNRLDIYLDNSMVAFLNPHRFVRRVLPYPDRMSYREISIDLLEQAEAMHSNEGVPIFMTLQQEGFMRKGELRDMMRQLGSEVLYEFLRGQEDCVYSYKRLDELPDYAIEHNLRIPVTPILLEGNKQRDDWRSMERIFPDPDQPLKAATDLIGGITSLDLGVLEIKMLSHIASQATPRDLVAEMGLPLQEVYRYLVRFAKDGVVEPPGDQSELQDIAMSVEESVEMAWQALDDNDDEMAVSSALDKVLGFGDGDDDDDDVESVVPGRRLRSVEERDD